MIGRNPIDKSQKLLTTKKFIKGKYSPYFSNSRKICCKQAKVVIHILKVVKPTEHLQYSKKQTVKVISPYTY